MFITLIAGVVVAGQPSKMLSDEAIGKKVYMAYCWNCHGELADGLGPQASALQVAPPPLINTGGGGTSEAKEISEKDPRISIILNGKGYMPAYEQLIDKHEARRVLIYLQDLEDDQNEASQKSKQGKKPAKPVEKSSKEKNKKGAWGALLAADC